VISDPLEIVLLIAGTAWLADWTWSQIRPCRPHVNRPSNVTEPDCEDSKPLEAQGSKLHADWLRLERRRRG
jgi:hypothetical protein